MMSFGAEPVGTMSLWRNEQNSSHLRHHENWEQKENTITTHASKTGPGGNWNCLLGEGEGGGAADASWERHSFGLVLVINAKITP